jgi:hypothetical protein
MKLYEKFEEKRDRFEILAFHDTKAKTLEEMDQKLARVIRERWGGKEFPFPILMDATGQTIKRYGIHKYPTLMLIDPEGRVVRDGDEKTLEKALAGE